MSITPGITPFDVAFPAQFLTERFQRRRVCVDEKTEARGSRLLRLASERRSEEPNRENDREPDQPHGHLL